ncbi:signal peptide peptidase SppA [Peristeroidobacter agariperforans]|uniref:signal peptide peptidase SppA n=1 Tax=Peristeroidobacter agariperforans TaxID=268404 RepID=UPI00101CC74B|nr:signal peptide peptidase SppA [Peristeroidobacter agariperforans]
MKAIAWFLTFIWRGLDGLRKVLHLIVLLVLFLAIGALISPANPIVPHKAALVLSPQGALVEQLAGDPFERAVAEAYGQSRPETLLRDLVDVVDTAAKDKRIELMVLDLSGMAGGGIAKMQELAAAIQRFRAAGKKVFAFGESFDQAQYYLAAQADEIYLDPHGLVLIEGFGYYRTFLKGVIDKLSVDVNVFRAGKFKSFTDQFSRSDMSEQEEQESMAWLNALWKQYLAGVAKARGLDEGAIAAYANEYAEIAKSHRGDLATAALERNLVTELKSRREFEDQIKALVGEDEDEHTFNGIMNWDYLAAARSSEPLLEGDRVGVVVASGEILDGAQPPGTIGSDSTSRLLRDALYDDSIKAVVLRIDSPGGSMLASEVIRREIDALRDAGKPVIASMSSTAASGGYYIAMDADEIWASPATLTGSIGVFAVFPTIERTLEKFGVTIDGVGTTPLAGSLRLDRTLNDGAKEILQNSIDHAYSVFVNNVATAREKSFQDIDEVAQGRVWAGVDAAQHGLVDKLGSYKDALNSAAEKAGLGKDYKVHYIEAPMGWRQALAMRSQALAARVTRALVPEHELFSNARRILAPLEAELTRLARFNDPKNVYYYCMCSAP